MTRTPAVTVAQMVEVDALMVDVAGISLVQMMENAGRAMAELTRRTLGGDVRGRPVVVLAGTGGNGGGGLVAARRLAGWGARVDVLLSGPPARLGDVPAHQLRALALTGVRWFEVTDEPRRPDDGGGLPALAAADAVVDAVIGYSLAGDPRGPARGLINAANAGSAPVLSLDLPSGLDGDTGRPGSPTMVATATLTLAMAKRGLLAAAARPFVGDLYVADIGVPPEVYRRAGVEVGDLFASADVVRVATES